VKIEFIACSEGSKREGQIERKGLRLTGAISEELLCRVSKTATGLEASEEGNLGRNKRRESLYGGEKN